MDEIERKVRQALVRAKKNTSEMGVFRRRDFIQICHSWLNQKEKLLRLQESLAERTTNAD